MKSRFELTPMSSRLLMVSILITTFIFTSGCKSMHSSQLSAPVSVTAESAPFEVKFAVGKRITGTAMARYLFGFQTEGPTTFSDGVSFNGSGNSNTITNLFGNISPVSNLKAAATYEAVSKSGADVIIAPRYVIEDENNFFTRKLKVTVSGYKGTISKVIAKKL